MPWLFDRYKVAPGISHPIQARTGKKAKRVEKQGMLGDSSKSQGVPRFNLFDNSFSLIPVWTNSVSLTPQQYAAITFYRDTG